MKGLLKDQCGGRTLANDSGSFKETFRRNPESLGQGGGGGMWEHEPFKVPCHSGVVISVLSWSMRASLVAHL